MIVIIVIMVADLHSFFANPKPAFLTNKQKRIRIPYPDSVVKNDAFLEKL
jgi:hypothetical protein